MKHVLKVCSNCKETSNFKTKVCYWCTEEKHRIGVNPIPVDCLDCGGRVLPVRGADEQLLTDEEIEEAY